MENIVAPGARWPDYTLALCLRLQPSQRQDTEDATRQAFRAEAWVSLRDALHRFVRRDAHKFRSLAREDLEDLASTKALELLTRVESGEWSLENRSGGELAGYLATVARNGLIDAAKRASRAPAALEGQAIDLDDDTTAAAGHAAPAGASDSTTMAREFIDELRGCVLQLQPRALRIWFFRAFYGMSSGEIAAHPDIALRPAHVDVIMQRARDSIRACMAAKGLEPGDMPAGTFVALWDLLESLRDDTQPLPEVAVKSR